MWIKEGCFLFSYKIHAGRNLPLILELSIRNPDISKTALKEKKDYKKLRNFNFLCGFSQKKLSTNQILVKRKQTFRKMAADNVETVFRLPSGINEGFIGNLLWQHGQQHQ